MPDMQQTKDLFEFLSYVVVVLGVPIGLFQYVRAQQKELAERYIAQLNTAKVFSKPIVTQVAALEKFYPAEAYHQNYLALHPTQPYIVYNDLPKIEALKKEFPDWYRVPPK